MKYGKCLYLVFSNPCPYACTTNTDPLKRPGSVSIIYPGNTCKKQKMLLRQDDYHRECLKYGHQYRSVGQFLFLASFTWSNNRYRPRPLRLFFQGHDLSLPAIWPWALQLQISRTIGTRARLISNAACTCMH